jgi:hypothetical protein
MKTLITCPFFWILAACASTYDERDPRILYLDGCGSFLQVTNARIEHVGSTPRFYAEVFNSSQLAGRALDWSVDFLDANGNPVAATDTRWNKLDLGRNERKTVSQVISNPKAITFQFKIKGA